MMKKGQTVYYTQIMVPLETFNLLELKVHTVKETWFTAIEIRTKRTYLFNMIDLDNVVFFDRDTALAKVKDSEKNHVKRKLTTDKVQE